MPESEPPENKTGPVPKEYRMLPRVLLALVFAGVGLALGLWLRAPQPTGEDAKLVSDTTDDRKVIEEFHKLFYRSLDQTWNQTFWLGVPALKCPLDLWVFQEIIFETRPDWIIEAGTFKGGSALFMANVMDAIGHGNIVTIDIEDFPGKPSHERITYLLGSSTSEEIVKQVRGRIGENDKVMVVLDSDHKAEHVLNELRIYGPLVSKGLYLVVEDTNVNGHPVVPRFGPGPTEALEEFLKEDDSFEVDKAREKFLLTFNPRGFLRKTR